MAFVVTTTVFGVLTALLLNEISSRSAVKYYQTTMFLPRFLSWVIVGFFTWLLLNPVIGVFNKLLATAGLEPVSWYTERRYWPFILISVNLWKVGRRQHAVLLRRTHRHRPRPVRGG